MYCEVHIMAAHTKNITDMIRPLCRSAYDGVLARHTIAHYVTDELGNNVLG
jgi:hypothetical protein